MDKGGNSKARAKLGCTSPAAPAKAADWMAGEFAKKGVKVTRDGDTLAGKDEDGDDFTIAFAPDGATSKGTVKIVSNRSEEHTSELQSLMRISYAVFCLNKKTNRTQTRLTRNT